VSTSNKGTIKMEMGGKRSRKEKKKKKAEGKWPRSKGLKGLGQKRPRYGGGQTDKAEEHQRKDQGKKPRPKPRVGGDITGVVPHK